MILFIVVVYFGKNYVTVDNLRQHRAQIEAFVKTHPVSAPLVFCCALAAVLACSLPGEMFLTVLCGVLISPWVVAVCTSWVAHIIGGIINFTILRIAWHGSPPPLWRSTRSSQYPQQPILPTTTQDSDEGVSPRSREWLNWIDRKVRGAPPWLLVTLRLVPPLFGPLNAAMAVVDVPLKTYIWTTAVGTLPAQVFLTFFARQVVDVILNEKPRPGDPEIEEDLSSAKNIWLQFLSPSTGFLPPRIRPWTVPLVVPFIWFAFLFIIGFTMQRWQLPASRMWRRHPLPSRRRDGFML